MLGYADHRFVGGLLRGFAAVRRAPGYYEDGEEGLIMRLTV
jgi:hypothetical protein